MRSSILTGLVLSSLAVQAQTTNGAERIRAPNIVNATSNGDSVSVAPSAGQVTRSFDENLTVRLINNCISSNLRNVGNPISPDGIITAGMTLTMGSLAVPIWVKFPGVVSSLAGLTQTAPIAPMAAANFSVPGAGSAVMFGNVIELKIPVTVSTTVNPDGSVVTADFPLASIDSTTFNQEMLVCGRQRVYGSYGHSASRSTYPCGAYMGRTGPVVASVGPPIASSDNRSIEISVTYPGQTGFCGGYWSPLMIFWSAERPTFTGISDFPLQAGLRTSWPEAGANASFIAFDRDGNGKIDQKNELFGDSEKNRNGFEALREFDLNKDEVIDKNDRKFSKLKLWQDQNGDGLSTENELVSLSEKISSLSLKYEDKRVRPIGRFAEEREKSFAILKGSKKKVDVVDMWFAPKQPSLAERD